MADRASFVVGLLSLLLAGLVLLDAAGSFSADPRVVAGMLVVAVGAAGLLVSWFSLRGRGRG